MSWPTRGSGSYADAGMDGVVAKPIDMHSLFDVMDAALTRVADLDGPGLAMVGT